MDAPWRSPVEFRSMVASLERRLARMEGILGPWGALPAKTLSDFLQLCVLIPRAETSEALQGGVLPEVERVLKVVHRLDARFGPDFQRSGSYIEGLKVSEPDEFDFLVPLKGLDEGSFSPGSSTLALREGRPDESFLAVTLGPCYDQACSTCGRGGKRGPASQCSWRHHDVADSLPSGRWLLNPQKVMGTFKQSVSEALRQEPGKVTVQRLQQGTPAVTLSVPHDQKEISVDLVPVIKNPFSEWSVPWPRPGQSWPSAEKIREIQDTGVDLVAKHNLFWRYSFSRIERVLLEKIDEDGGRRRDSLRILKKVREDHWKNKYGKVLVSYHLKTVLFWACEENPSENDWEDLTEGFVRLVDYLVDYLQKGNLPHYFLGSDVNLFKPEHSPRLQELLDDVIKFKTSPMKYLK